jgi:membrane fusion protein (multidrug efflux system)
MQTNLLSRKSASSAPTGVPPRKRARGAVFKVVLALIGVFILIGGIKAMQIRKLIKAGSAMVPPPTTVTSAKVEKADWQPMLTAVGSITPVQGATISAELPGTVSEISFQSGTPVKKGDVLLKLDASAEQAQLRSAEADAALAKADLDRARDLAARKVISQAELDAAQAKYQQKQAGVDNMKSIIDKKEIRAPFDGIAGIREVNPGQMVPVGQKLVSLQALDKVFVDFSLPQQRLAQITPDLPVKVTTDAIDGREFDGKLTAINSAIDPVTRSVSLQATIENADHALRAGMFARVKVLLPQANSVLFVPATAVLYAPFGNSVFIIEKKQDEKTGKDHVVIRQQFIRTGETRGDFVAVTKDQRHIDGEAGAKAAKNELKQGDEVVSTGVFKLRNGIDVAVDNTLSPKPDQNPKPADT